MLRWIAEHHALQAPLLWRQRELLADAPHSGFVGLERADARLEAHLDAFHFAGPLGQRLVLDQADAGPGEIFTATVVTTRAGDDRGFASVLDRCVRDPAYPTAVVAALSWVSSELADPVLDRLLGARHEMLLRLGLAACAARGRDPGEAALVRAFGSTRTSLRTQAARACGDLGLRERLRLASEDLGAPEPEARFWSARSALLLGDPAATEHLADIAASGTDRASEAADLAARAIDAPRVRRFISGLADRGRIEAAICAIRAAGDPSFLPRLVEWCADERLGPLAGEAITRITGTRLDRADLDQRRSDRIEHLTVTADRFLPIPDPARVRAWWARSTSSLSDHPRLFLGQPMVTSVLERALVGGTQRERASAAMELCLRNGRPRFDVRAPSPTQRARIASAIA